VTHPAVIKELHKLFEKGKPPMISVFLHKKGDSLFSSSTAAEESASDEPNSHAEDLSGSDPLEALHHVGTRARIMQAAPFSQRPGSEGLQMLLHGIDLVRLDKVLDPGPPLRLQVSLAKHEEDADKDMLKAYIKETMHTIREIMKINPQFREHTTMIHQGLERIEASDPNAIAHFAASLSNAPGPEQVRVLEAETPSKKLELALVLLKKELEVSQLQHKIASQIEDQMNKTQREFMMREQLKRLKSELGEDKSDGTDKLVAKFKSNLEGKTVPKEAKEAIDSELEKFSNLAKESQEYQTTRNYLDWLTMLPWESYSKEVLSLNKAREVLDKDHHGLKDVKDRILEFISVGALRGSVQGQIICFVGPPGVGKTSIGRSIAEALGREFYRFSVGGLYDVAEIKGHRRTYVGAMPGKIIQCLKKVQTSNPLVLIDEIDKLGRGHQGDPASALLELLDPSQNGSFMDHYLDVPVDCSKILFVCTANTTDTIAGPLLDRMEVIRLSGYDLQEKMKIAEDYLVPKAMRDSGLWPSPTSPQAIDGEAPGETTAVEDAPAQTAAPGQTQDGAAPSPDSSAAQQPDRSGEVAAASESSPAAEAKSMILPKISVKQNALEALIRWYCREAGVRNLQKHVEKICRKLAIKVVERNEAKDGKAGDGSETACTEEEICVNADNLSDFVGKQVFTSDRLYDSELPPGTVTGLAWTSMGGSVLYMEATAIPRIGDAKVPPSLSVTGQLGNVMKESSQLALVVARREASRLDADAAKFFEQNELYLHCPEGATPKDGPSAGITMTTALLSLALQRPLRADLAMTGEVSLNGKVMAVGGIKEKTIAARRAGCKALVFPQANKRDFEELPEYLKEGLDVTYAANYDDVLAVAFPEA
jgi:Lon-like ATP-dependent protease